MLRQLLETDMCGISSTAEQTTENLQETPELHHTAFIYNI